MAAMASTATRARPGTPGSASPSHGSSNCPRGRGREGRDGLSGTGKLSGVGSSEPRNGRWAVCRPRALTRRWRCCMPGAPGQGTRPTAVSRLKRPRMRRPKGATRCQPGDTPGSHAPLHGMSPQRAAQPRRLGGSRGLARHGFPLVFALLQPTENVEETVFAHGRGGLPQRRAADATVLGRARRRETSLQNLSVLWFHRAAGVAVRTRPRPSIRAPPRVSFLSPLVPNHFHEVRSSETAHLPFLGGIVLARSPRHHVPSAAFQP
jgi:hypothetical protein